MFSLGMGKIFMAVPWMSPALKPYDREKSEWGWGRGGWQGGSGGVGWSL